MTFHIFHEFAQIRPDPDGFAEKRRIFRHLYERWAPRFTWQVG